MKEDTLTATIVIQGKFVNASIIFQNFDKILPEIAKQLGYMDEISIVSYDEFHWPALEIDMCNFSKQWPEAIFRLDGYSPANGSYFRYYFHNGKMQFSEEQITFDDYDENLLKEPMPPEKILDIQKEFQFEATVQHLEEFIKWKALKIPKLYEVEHQKDPIAHIKLFTPDTQWTWWILEWDGEDTFFGLVNGQEQELGYFSFSELKSVRGHLGLSVEIDLYFSPQPLSKVEKGDS
jgi:hypothetical protein